jgi:hypothetical protein
VDTPAPPETPSDAAPTAAETAPPEAGAPPGDSNDSAVDLLLKVTAPVLALWVW